MLHFHHADIAFRLIVVKRNLKIVHKSQHRLFVALKLIQQVLGRALLDPSPLFRLIFWPFRRGIGLTAEPGQMVAILGATGAGKSTLINLVPRFYDSSEGRILIDVVDIRQVRQDSLLAHVGIVPQETVLFSGTVRDNIRYGRPDASDGEVVTAAKAAQAHEFILDLPDGYETHVEERGVNLSGGQKQRIAIARALLIRPSILILDDSTSSVDVETETKIQSALDKLMEGRTSFVVAQRISTVLKADKIVVIDKG